MTKNKLTLGQTQELFAELLPRLIDKAHELGFRVRGGEWWRPGDGRCHGMKIAVDLNLFKNGVYQRSTESHRQLGEWWEKQHTLCRWGGRFEGGDGNHYSLTYGGYA